MRQSFLLIAICGALAATSASASPVAAGGGAAYPSGPGATMTAATLPTVGNAYRKHQAILALAHEGKAMQESDGGTLTLEHHAYLQAKFDAIRAGNY